MGSRAESAPIDLAAHAARSAHDLVASQSVLPSRPAGPSGRTRSPEPALPITAAFLDYMNAARDEIVEHARADAPSGELGGPAPATLAAAYALIGRQNPDLDPARQLVRDALLYRQGLEHTLYQRDTSEIRNQHCPSCLCLSLHWRWEFRAAVCFNPGDLDRTGRNRRFTLQQIAETAVQDLTIAAATS